MTDAVAAIALNVEQTDQGLRLTKGASAVEPHTKENIEPVTEWASHIFVPRLFYLWAVDNSDKPDSPGAWARAGMGEINFYLEGTWARYGMAHRVQGGHHYNLLDSGTS